MSEIKDQKQRDIIKNKLDKNIFVEAGAGSGKTHSLVERMVSMVKSGIDVSKISAITFTKAAAVEFYNRFENMLSEAINSDIPEKEKRLCEKALLEIDLCFMGTIDAFCNMVLSENPIEAGIPLNSTIVSDEEYRFLIKSEYNNIIKDLKDSEDIAALKDFMRFQLNPKDAFTECMYKILDKRNNTIETKDRKEIIKKEEEFYNKYQEDIQKLIKGFTDENGKYIYEGSGGAKDDKEYVLNNEWVVLNEWRERPTAVINFLNKGLKKVCIEKNIQKMSRTFNDYFEEKKLYYGPVKEKVEDIIKEFKTIKYDYTISFVARFIEKVSNRLIQKGKLTFFDNLYLFRNLLKKDIEDGGELIKHITNRHEYYLIDEFQDTNPIQAEIAFYLTAEKPNVDFTLCKPKPGRLFIVGDPKQSIYRFRNADVISYNYIKELFAKNGDEFLELTSNFRTQSKLIEYFNKQFKSTFNELYDGLQAPFKSVDYVDRHKDKPILEGIYKYEASDITDASCVGNLIVNLIDNGYKYSDVMVLTSTKARLKDYMEVFEDKSIPYEIEGKSVFDDCEVFINLRYLLGAIANPDDSYYVYKALKKVLKISDSHIYSVFNNKGPTLIEDIKDKQINRLTEFYKNNKDNDAVVVFNNLIEEFDLLNISSVRHLEYLYYAKELLREQVANFSVVTLKEAYKFLNDITEKNIVEKCISLSKGEEDNRVLLANVHKVKGLERKVVILTSNYKSASTNPTDDVEIHTSFKKKQNYFIKVPEPGTFNTYIIETDEYKKEQESEGRALLCEEDRIAYVAATRAKDVLFVSSNSLNEERKKKTPWGDLISDDAVQSLIKQDDTLFTESKVVLTKQLKASSLKTSVTKFDKSIFDNTYKIKSPSKLVHVLEKENEESSNPINAEATLKGTLVHRLLELYVSNKFNDSLDTYLTIINNEQDIDQSFKDLLTNVYNTMKNGGYKQDDGKITDLVSELKKAEEVICEVPFAYKDGNDIYNGIIDLLYKKDNKWFIVDYKTNLDPKELDKKYENQLDGYKKALSSQGIDAEAYIYHIDIK